MAEITIRTGVDKMDINMVHKFLTEESYWAKGIAFELVDNAMKNSFCIGAFENDRQIGFGRVITDYNTFAWLADFFILSEFRGQGISKKMLFHLFEQKWMKRLRRIMLNTSDAHGLYRQFDFKDLTNPTFILEIYRPNIHLLNSED